MTNLPLTFAAAKSIRANRAKETASGFSWILAFDCLIIPIIFVVGKKNHLFNFGFPVLFSLIQLAKKTHD